MNKNKIIKIIFALIIVVSLIFMIRFSYTYFTLNIDGDGKYTVLNTGDLKFKYTDDILLSLDNALPGDTIEKASYNLIWSNLINTIDEYDLHLDISRTSYKDYSTTNKSVNGEYSLFYKSIPYTETSMNKNIKKNNEIDVNITHEYKIKITFLNRPYSQNNNLNKVFKGKISLEEYKDTIEEVYCKKDDTLVQRLECVNGDYTYRYKQEGGYSPGSDLAWNNIITDGWGVQLTNKSSTSSVNSKLCTYINDKPVVTMKYMFSESEPTNVDLSSFNTKHITNMLGMFQASKISTLDLSSFNTSNVTEMGYMFNGAAATTIDTSSFDTSKVTNMTYMFNSVKASTLDLSNFDTTNVTNTSFMLYGSNATKIDISSFNTSKVTNMTYMFGSSKVSMLDLNNIDTSKVTNMSFMFYGNNSKYLDLSNFNTSNVTNMSYMLGYTKSSILDVTSFNTSKVKSMNNMFEGINITKLDLSSFDTSSVTNMTNMFNGNPSLRTIYASDKFVTDQVTSSNNMFNGCTSLVGGYGTLYNSNNVDKTYARIDSSNNKGYFTQK